MIVKGLTPAQIQGLIRSRSHDEWGSNIVFNRAPEQYRGSVRFTLRCESSRGPGHRRGFQGRHMAAACFHAYTDMIKEIVKAGGRVKGVGFDGWITEDNIGEAYDAAGRRNIGSMIEPLSYQEACDCDL